MALKQRIHEQYRKIKYSKSWETNRLLSFIYPLFRVLALLLIFIYQKIYLPLKRSRPGRQVRTFRARLIRKIKRFTINTLLSYTARAAVLFRSYGLARRLFNLVLVREKNKNKQRSENINDARFNLSVINRLINIDKYKKEIADYKSKNKGPKIAIYTAIAGGYDTIKMPEKLQSNADYFLFTDRPVQDTDIFKIRPLPYYHIDTPRMTRYVKTHPHHLFEGYDLAIWIDANIMIMDDLSKMIDDFVKSKSAVGAIPHPLRKTIYQEFKACVARNKEDENLLKEQIRHYKKIGYVSNELIESNVMIFDLKNKKTADFLNTWWTEIDKFTRRDQLSLNYSLDKNKISWHPIMKRPQNARNHPLFTLVPHETRQKSLAYLTRALSTKLIKPYEGPAFSNAKKKIIKQQGNRRVDVVYCVHNALDDVKVCLASVAKYRKNPNLKLIIIDDGSDKLTADFLRGFKAKHSAWVELQRKETGSGYTKAANRGLKASSGEFVILLNSDTIVTDGWSEKLAEAVFNTPGGGIVGPLSSAAGHQSIPNHIGTSTQTATNELPKKLNADDVNKHCEEWSVLGYYPYVPLVHGFCFGLTRDVINKVGYFDEKHFPFGYGEENDYCFRAMDAGFVLLVATNTYIFHAKSKSYEDERRIRLKDEGNAALRGLWGKPRIDRSVKSALNNPSFEKFRSGTRKLYARFR